MECKALYFLYNAWKREKENYVYIAISAVGNSFFKKNYKDDNDLKEE